jgi:hypothetical protein
MNMSREQQHLLGRIGKLERLASDRNPNAHERASAATKLAELRAIVARRWPTKARRFSAPSAFGQVHTAKDITQRKGYYEIHELQKRIPMLTGMGGLQAANIVAAWYAEREISDRDWQWLREIIHQ